MVITLRRKAAVLTDRVLGMPARGVNCACSKRRFAYALPGIVLDDAVAHQKSVQKGYARWQAPFSVKFFANSPNIAGRCSAGPTRPRWAISSR